MAIMHPSQFSVDNYDCRSREQELFESLSKLPDEYHVFYSLKVFRRGRYERIMYSKVWNNLVIQEREIDFIVFHRQKGILLIEAKAGNINCKEGNWYYSSGDSMRDPFKQVDAGKWNMERLIEERVRNGTDIVRRCKIHIAVWFPSITRIELERKTLPTNAISSIILTADEIDNPIYFIERLFACDNSGKGGSTETTISKEEMESIFSNVFCPTFEICESLSARIENTKRYYNKLLQEQLAILNFLEDQRFAVINGAAGTGKTMIAVEKAKRHATNGEKVLFLCYNKRLKEYLARNYAHENIAYFTLDGYSQKIAHCTDYSLLKNKLESIDFDSYEYKHIIVDEGQDLGGEAAIAVLKILQTIMSLFDDRTFYLFYDKYQCIQGQNSRDSQLFLCYISEADCKLTLYKNCRNTISIAKTAMAPLCLCKAPILRPESQDGVIPSIHFVQTDDVKQRINIILDKLLNEGFDASSIAILTADTEEESVIYCYVDGEPEDRYFSYCGKRIIFTTCRKFKGLEADCVIIIDVKSSTIIGNKDEKTDEVDKRPPMIFYAGASRARFRLDIIANIEPTEISQILAGLKFIGRHKLQDVAAALHAIKE